MRILIWPIPKIGGERGSNAPAQAIVSQGFSQKSEYRYHQNQPRNAAVKSCAKLRRGVLAKRDGPPRRGFSVAVTLGIRQEKNGFPAVFNVEADPREENDVFGTNAWVIGPYLKVVGEYLKSLEKYPNPKPVNLTEFGK